MKLTDKCLDMLASTDKEVDRIVDQLEEQEAKLLLKTLVKAVNCYMRGKEHVKEMILSESQD